MASLKNIMNTDDEHVDPRPGSRFIDLTSRSPSAHSYATSLNHSRSSSSHINRSDPPGPPSRISYAVDHSSLPTPDLDMNSRRRSNTSVGSSEPGPSSNSPMRPLTAGAAGGEPHVKLTPITRKISKAKKGVPVHTCNQCPKTFSRAEHLRRHQLSHSPPDLCCPIAHCNKTFYRKDLLDRHIQRHEHDSKDDRETKQAIDRTTPKTPTLSYANTTRGNGLQMPEAFNDSRIDTVTASGTSSTMVHGSWLSMPPTSRASQNYNVPSTMPGPPDNYPMDANCYGLGISQLATTNSSFVSAYTETTNAEDIPMVSIPQNPTPEPRWPDSSTMHSSASESAFSTPPDNTTHTQFSVRTPSGSWINPISAFQTTSSDTNIENATYPVSFAYSSTPPHMYTSVFGDMGLPLPGYSDGTTFNTADQIAGSTVRSISPPLAVAQSETLAAVPSLPPTDGVFDLAGCSSGPPDGGSILSTEELMPLSLPETVSEAIPTYLDVYWEKVHPKIPIVHKHTFGEIFDGEEEHLEVLQCAMAALATQFIPEADDRVKGAQLHAYAWQKSKVVVGNQYASASRSSARGRHQAWKTWIAIETQRRLLAACFLLDIHSSRYYERGHVSALGLDYSSPSTLPISLTAVTTQLWEAEDPQAWAKRRTTKDPKTISNINFVTLSASEVASAPAFDAAILLAAYSLCLPRRRSLEHVKFVDDIVDFKLDGMAISKVFAGSAVANTYLALHYTPLYHLLSCFFGTSEAVEEMVQFWDRSNSYSVCGTSTEDFSWPPKLVKSSDGPQSGE
ncbi:hypothetical protein F66182_2702 [Fusarium sp. NRRL 66182]|nr:hypothetical protein F66182_2702 [Fusarium sp. NRRL 66182]